MATTAKPLRLIGSAAHCVALAIGLLSMTNCLAADSPAIAPPAVLQYVILEEEPHDSRLFTKAYCFKVAT